MKVHSMRILKPLLKVLGVFVCLIVLALLVMTILGARLPREHTASASATIDAPQARVWQLIIDSGSQSGWREGLKSVEPMPPRNGHPCWKENSTMGSMPLCEVAAAAPTLRVVQISDPNLSFGGEWVYALTPADASRTGITITENGTTGPAIWRFFGHYIFHEDTFIKQYERDLQQRAARNP